MAEGRVPARAIVEAFQLEEDIRHRFEVSKVEGTNNLVDSDTNSCAFKARIIEMGAASTFLLTIAAKSTVELQVRTIK